MNRRVAIGCTVGHDYSAFLPFVATLWRDRIGYEPTFFLVGSEIEWSAHRYAYIPYSYLIKEGFDIRFVEHIEGIEDGTIAQCVRQHAAASDYPLDDLLICSDADLLPIRREFYYTHDPDKHAIGLYYSNGYDSEKDWHWPSCHYSMRVSTWREVMGLDVPLAEAMRLNFSDYGLVAKMEAKRLDPAKYWGHVWFTDEFVASKKIKASRYYIGSIHFIEREGHPPCDRLDRACWPATYDIAGLTDCHSIRPIWNDDNWPRFRPLLQQLMPERIAWADEYRTLFRNAMGVPR